MIGQNNIIIASIMLGSVHILSTCLKGLNKYWMKYGKSDFSLFEMINLSIGLIAGTVLMVGYKSIENR